MDRVTVIGLGRMGSALARRFSTQGAAVTGWTRSGITASTATEWGIEAAPDFAAAVSAADVLVLSLYDDAAVAEVLDRLLEQDTHGKLIIETSTADPKLLTERDAAFAQAGASLTDAPISGGPEMVLNGTCGILLGGAPQARAQAAQVLGRVSERVIETGALGTGQVMKVINNALHQAYFAMLRPMVQLAKRAGLPLELVLQTIAGGPAATPMFKGRVPKILGDDPEVGFALAGALKDARHFSNVTKGFGVDARLFDLAIEGIDRAAKAGLGEEDIARMITHAYDTA